MERRTATTFQIATIRCMPHVSEPSFRTLHALRIKGFAKVEIIAEIAANPLEEVEAHLGDLQARELAMFREARALWQLTPTGKEHHLAALAGDTDDGIRAALREPYEAFLHHNDAFKTLCGDWQLRNGTPNDHSDAGYDDAVIERLVALHRESSPVVSAMAEVLARVSPYTGRLAQALASLTGGQHNMFTGVMCNSYHDIWMELHEDLILTQGIDRAKEGSF
jgi:hypothetical protein